MPLDLYLLVWLPLLDDHSVGTAENLVIHSSYPRGNINRPHGDGPVLARGTEDGCFLADVTHVIWDDSILNSHYRPLLIRRNQELLKTYCSLGSVSM